MFADFIFTSFLSMIFFIFPSPCLLSITSRSLWIFCFNSYFYLFIYLFSRIQAKEKKHPQHDQKIYNKNRTRVKTKNKYSFVQKL